MFLQILTESSIFAKFSLIVAVAPLVMGILYALRPNEARLALMRPLSLASLFAGLAALIIGLMNILRGMAATATVAITSGPMMLGIAEALTPLFVAFWCLTVGWICVTLGLMRQR